MTGMQPCMIGPAACKAPHFAFTSIKPPAIALRNDTRPRRYSTSSTHLHLCRNDIRLHQRHSHYDTDPNDPLVTMRFLPFIAAALAVVPGALAVDQKKSAIVWFDDLSTPDSVVDEVKKCLTDAGGKITHMYTIIKYVPTTRSNSAVMLTTLGDFPSSHPRRPSNLSGRHTPSTRSRSRRTRLSLYPREGEGGTG